MGRKLNRIAVLSVIAVTALTAVPAVADLYLNHCLYRNCRLFASNHHIRIVSRQTGKGELA